MDDVSIVPLDQQCWPELTELFGLTQQAAKPTAGVQTGLVALHDGRAVGWTSLAPREQFHRLTHSRGIPTLPGDSVWSIVCFVVGRAARRQGLGSDLLATAIDYAASHGAAIIEGYPVGSAPGRRVPSAAAYTGLESTFLRAGFTRVGETTSKAAGVPRVVVRRTIT